VWQQGDCGHDDRRFDDHDPTAGGLDNVCHDCHWETAMTGCDDGYDYDDDDVNFYCQSGHGYASSCYWLFCCCCSDC